MRTLLVLSIVLALLPPRPALAWDPLSEVEEDPVGVPDSTRIVVPDGLYLVTEVYDGESVTTVPDGTAVYATMTVQRTPGTYARIVDVVGTGVASPFDGASFNPRVRVPDGRLVGGTYYEDFVLTADGFASVNIVFFQDDRFSSRDRSVPDTGSTVPPGRPIGADGRVPVPPSVTARVSIAEDSPALAEIEVLRGRRVTLWPRVFVDGAPVPTRSWRLASGVVEEVFATAGVGADPCVVAWLLLPPPGEVRVLRFEVTSDAAPGRVLEATIRVTVRSPALLQ